MEASSFPAVQATTGWPCSASSISVSASTERVGARALSCLYCQVCGFRGLVMPVLLLSGSVGPDVDWASQVGANAQLPKPFRIDEFRATVGSLLAAA